MPQHQEDCPESTCFSMLQPGPSKLTHESRAVAQEGAINSKEFLQKEAARLRDGQALEPSPKHTDWH